MKDSYINYIYLMLNKIPLYNNKKTPRTFDCSKVRGDLILMKNNDYT